MSEFHLTKKQEEGKLILASSATHIMFAGGARAAKTFLLVLAIVTRALRAPGSRHAILRFRFGHVKQSIVFDTFPKVMSLCFPELGWSINDPACMNRSMWFAILPGGSEVWFGGLDDKERTEKIFGMEFVTIFLNECSQIPYNSRNLALTRLAQKVMAADGTPLPLRMYYEENTPDKGHWTYKLFKTHTDPDTKGLLPDPENYAFLQMNPSDNQENISPEYMKTLEALPLRLRKRFLDGEFRDLAVNALFTDEMIDKWRAIENDLPQMIRIVVAVDPSGADDTDNLENDEIGIVVCGLGTDGNGYVLEDLTCRVGPATWGRIATQAYERHSADRIVAEVNYGGAMVKAVIQAARPRTPFRPVTASRGKAVRAEPIATMMEMGKIRMAGVFRDLEDELTSFTTHGYTGDHSPNHADAMVWGMSDLFPELLKTDKPAVLAVPVPIAYRSAPNAWMRNL